MIIIYQVKNHIYLLLGKKENKKNDDESDAVESISLSDEEIYQQLVMRTLSHLMRLIKLMTWVDSTTSS